MQRLHGGGEAGPDHALARPIFPLGMVPIQDLVAARIANPQVAAPLAIVSLAAAERAAVWQWKRQFTATGRHGCFVFRVLHE